MFGDASDRDAALLGAKERCQMTLLQKLHRIRETEGAEAAHRFIWSLSPTELNELAREQLRSVKLDLAILRWLPEGVVMSRAWWWN